MSAIWSSSAVKFESPLSKGMLSGAIGAGRSAESARGVRQVMPASDITPLTGDAGKLGLSIETLFFDIIFIFQHYVLYSKRKRGSSYKFLED